jgi:hypothetical protein
MDDQVPDNLKKAAIMQLVSGLINFLVMPTLIWTFAGMCSFFTFGLSSFCGLATCLLWPVSILEIVSGAMGLAQPKNAGGIMKIASFVEMGSILAGGLVSAVIGFMVMNMLSEDEVQLYLEG